MATIIPFPTPKNMRIRLNREAAAKVGEYLCLRPAPTETRGEFVARIVTAYHEEADGK